MSHELTSDDHMVSANNVTPWHRLGTVVAGLPTAQEALTAARLNWQIVQEPIFDGDMKSIPSHRLNRRDDSREVIGVVPKGWQPVQNERLLEIAEALAQVDGDYRPVIETAGSLSGGRIVWALVRIGERQFADSPHRSYLLLSNGHDGTRAVTGRLTDVRVVCANTLKMAETDASRLYVTHARGVAARLATAIETIGWANEATRATFAIYEALAKTKVAIDQARLTFRGLLTDDRDQLTPGELTAIDVMTELFRSGRGNTGTTAFDVVNAVTDWVDHVKVYRSDERTDERRFINSNLGGEADRLKSSAFRAAKRLAAINGVVFNGAGPKAVPSAP